MKKSILFSSLAILIAGFVIVTNKVNAENYSEEFKQAYSFAYKNGITTTNSIEKAQMDSPLTRIAMAKMLSQFAMNVLGKKPSNSIVPTFSDISKELNEEYGGAVDLAYQLGIMGINMKNNEFRPHASVTRAEFSTALSRMLYGLEDGNPYYTTHLKKLKEEGIITNDNPSIKEKRGYVMLMLMRSQKNRLTSEKTSQTENKNPELLEKSDTSSDFIIQSTINGVNLLTICNPKNDTECLTIMDKNLGATTNDITNIESYGYHFQWGNNYGFPNQGTLNISTEIVDTSGYGPENYYSSNIFITPSATPYDWSKIQNDNLRGGSGDNKNNNRGYPVTNPTNRQGPCPDGYHIPSRGERGTLLTYWIENYTGAGNEIDELWYSDNFPNFGTGDNIAAEQFQIDFKIPLAGFRQESSSIRNNTYSKQALHAGFYSSYWSSTPLDGYSRMFFISSSFIQDYNIDNRARGNSIRCFKNQ